MNEYLLFRKMITPSIIQILFWIGVGVCVIAGISGIAAGASARFGGGGGQVLGGVLVLLVGPIFVRVYCELIIVLFRILDVLKEIRGPSADADTPVGPAAPSDS